MSQLPLIFLVGVATWYGPGFYGQPLYCGGFYQVGTPPWAAVDPGVFQEGWECGDELLVRYEDGTDLILRLSDAGPLSNFYIEDFGPDTPIVLDIPKPFWAPPVSIWSAPVRVVNVTRLQEALEGRIPQ